MNDFTKDVPLASIEEYDDDDADDETIVDESELYSKLKIDLGSKFRNDISCLNRESTLENHQDDSNRVNQEFDYESDDVGFFSSLSISKQSSLDFNDFGSNSKQGDSLASRSKSSCTKHIQYEEDREIDDEEDLLVHLPGDCNLNDSVDHNGIETISISDSLEDLVNSFDEKVKNCLKNLDENISELAPVRRRSADDVIKNRPAWYTLTGNYGDLLPIDWENYLQDVPKISKNFNPNSQNDAFDNEDDGVEHRNFESNSLSQTLIKTADEVLQEIDEMICSSVDQDSEFHSSQFSSSSQSESDSFDNVPLILRSTFYRFSLDKLKTLTSDQLQDLIEDLESKISKHSQELVRNLSERDELEFEKEIQITFLSMLIKLKKRRKECLKKMSNSKKTSKMPRYLTTVIPYCDRTKFNDIKVLQYLIRILKAILEDSPAVPTMLTDYILKFICPSDSRTILESAKKTSKSFNSFWFNKPNPTNTKITESFHHKNLEFISSDNIETGSENEVSDLLNNNLKDQSIIADQNSSESNGLRIKV
ncbi:hypothetical protein NH340_JMT02417 [Sarcoptes scabiei]|nr:hypothetical protein NH340_JMT02417 [Sarcoptes scabiei]